MLVGFAVGADASGIEAGLWGYNPVLGAIAVGVRWRLTLSSVAPCKF